MSIGGLSSGYTPTSYAQLNDATAAQGVSDDSSDSNSDDSSSQIPQDGSGASQLGDAMAQSTQDDDDDDDDFPMCGDIGFQLAMSNPGGMSGIAGGSGTPGGLSMVA